MKIIVISLKRSIERRKRIEKQLTDQGLPFEFFDAIDASEKEFLHSDRANNKVTYKRKGYYLLTSEIACFSSHFEIWKKCIFLNEPMIILEDNVDINSDFHHMIKPLADLMKKYNYIKLSATYKSNFKLIDNPTLPEPYKLVKYFKPTCGTTAYIISPDAAQKLLTNAEQFLEPVDNYIDKPWNHGVKYVNIFPDLFTRAQIKTTISKNRKRKLKINIIHKAYIEIYRLKNQILNLIYK